MSREDYKYLAFLFLLILAFSIFIVISPMIIFGILSIGVFLFCLHVVVLGLYYFIKDIIDG